MACPGSKIKDEFLKYIADTGFSFEIREEKLRLFNDGTVLKFNRSNAGS